MAMTPESLPENNIIDFRAPPPSPVASGRRSSVRNEDVLSEFLEHSLKVPDLILPDRVFPRQKSIANPPKLDLQSITSLQDESTMKFIESVAQTGCFEAINHGISHDLLNSVLQSGDGIFTISPEKRKLVTRSLERPYGFEEGHGEEEREWSEEFVWCRDERLKMDMEGIWPLEYSNFSDKMEKLLSVIEGVAEKILVFLQQNTSSPTTCEDAAKDGEFGSICYLNKHCRMVIGDDESVNSMRYDIIRMLIRGSEFPHALCLHVCNGSEEFHVYSKKGWISFQPDKDSLVITIGDQLQARSGGQLKHVIGRPIFKGIDRDHISVAFLYSASNLTNQAKIQERQSISISQQIMIAILLTLLYHLIVCICQTL